MRALPLVVLLLTACATEDPPREAPPNVGEVAGPEAEPSVTAGPNEAIRIEAGEVGVVLVTNESGAYDVDLSRGVVTESIDEGPLNEAAVDAWLAQFSPLDGESTFEAVDPAEVEADYSALLTFQFTDGSDRNVWIQRRDAGLAVLTAGGGRVFRLPDSRYADLVPEAGTLREDTTDAE
ncbi:MAG: hypothetical protein AAGI52_00100 [Bacteroidota bacterium]